jgi:CelD/BcsL family acetyltransferase involved in cellulose biosynthesis
MKRHHGLLKSRVLALNQALDASWDQVFVEYNGFFDSDPTCFSDLLWQLVKQLEEDLWWDEFRLSGLTAEDAESAIRLGEQRGLVVRVVDRRPTFARSLAEDRRRGDLLAGLSANTRAQIRRSRRLITSVLGPIQLDCAQSIDESRCWFDQIGLWHRQRWGAQMGQPSSSGFDNPAFVHFHHTLIQSAFPADQVRLWRLSAGGHTFAWLYNFRVDQTEAFYLGAWDPDLDPSMRAGLVAQQTVIERCLQEGLETYDFMAGESQYKRQLANEVSDLYWLVMQRPRWKFRIEEYLRRMKHLFQKT